MRIKTGAVVFAAATAVFGMTADSARADLKLEQTVETKGADPFLLFAGAEPPKAGKIKTKTVTYYKGDKRRVESGGVIRIFDDVSNTFTVLDAKAKTYFVVDTAKEIAAADKGLVPEFAGSADVTDTAETKPLNGKDSRHYRYTITIRMTLPGSQTPLATFTMKGDQWVSDAIGTGVGTPKQSRVALLAALPPQLSKGLKPVTDKLATIKGFVLEETQSTTLASVIETGAPKEPFESVTKTDQISEAPLPDSLFAPPSDYKKIDPPRA
ncbi:MAG: hypothetical protein H7145_03785 [Akkermansiaceae bacterium]|nr:hypothetical protein [Armatimonadota bacterium]